MPNKLMNKGPSWRLICRLHKDQPFSVNLIDTESWGAGSGEKGIVKPFARGYTLRA